MENQSIAPTTVLHSGWAWKASFPRLRPSIFMNDIARFVNSRFMASLTVAFTVWPPMRSSKVHLTLKTYSRLECLKVSWSLTSPFSTNMAISETKGQQWRPTQWRKASHILTSTLATFCSAATQQRERDRKERKSIYIAPFYILRIFKVQRHGSHSFICKYTMPAFPS